ncbi:carcinoembryonic antigen-related cell adhesion molecule 3-like [Leucoraja erinacea]|uniref:carcinoembryonic antigen-related cell adhesion molecule 3-like n=1 Tax=Leucoraja erinaceus TaxID=7782 RepID=UPI0024557F83|nr:carcinoembryonic antigen-related cell adhesion molecule 3-like [Leucoraja erinacea]
MVLRSVKESDNGDYRLTVNATGVSAQVSTNHTLHALEPVANVTLRASDSSPREHFDAVVLTCSARGTQLQRDWLFHNDPVRANYRITIAGDTLLIARVQRTDTGWYTCIVSNGLNNESAETFVNVYRKYRDAQSI